MTPAFRPFLWLLLAAALFARAFVPQGYMPERTAQSTIAVAICGSDAHWELPLGDKGKAPAEKKAAADPPCAFAGLGAPALPPGPPPELQRLFLSEGVYSKPAVFAMPAAGPRLLPPATGPPLAA